jgi:hypothetical protein
LSKVVDWRSRIGDLVTERVSRLPRTLKRSLYDNPQSTITNDSTIKDPDINNYTLAVFSAANTRSLRNGTRRIRTPVASKTAFAIAASVGLQTVSPAP